MSLLHFRCKERRRTLRVNLTVPLAVHGESEEGGKFCAHTHSLSISQHGGMMECNEVLLVGQMLQIVNENSNRKAEARVVSVQRNRDGERSEGVEVRSGEHKFCRSTV